MVAGGHMWLPGGMHGWSGEGACMVAGGMHGLGGHAWWGHVWWGGGMYGCQGVCVWLLGACMVAKGGKCGCWGEVCVVVGGHAWLPGGICGCQGACMVGQGKGHAWLQGAFMVLGCVHGGGHVW